MAVPKSAVSRQFVKQSIQALARLMSPDLSHVDFVAVYMDGGQDDSYGSDAGAGDTDLYGGSLPSSLRPSREERPTLADSGGPEGVTRNRPGSSGPGTFTGKGQPL